MASPMSFVIDTSDDKDRYKEEEGEEQNDCFSQLHEDTWQWIVLYLDAPDILTLLQVNRTMHHQLKARQSLWQALLEREQGGTTTAKESFIITAPTTTNDAAENYKKLFLQASYQRLLPVVQWQALGPNNVGVLMSGREAHLACVLGTFEQVLIMTQGFTDDNSVYLKPLDGGAWKRLRPETRGPHRLQWAYGATLTPLPNLAYAAVRVGGFTEGGYTGETSQVAVLTVEKNQNDEWQAFWEVKECATESGRPLTRLAPPSRAYHAATLVLNRFLLIVGGIKEGQSIMECAILDTDSWKWMDQTPLDLTTYRSPTFPMGRHGCSFIWDGPRQRLVLFGGATGRDIVRSGEDVCDVWQLSPQQTVAAPLTHESFLASLPWKWQLLHDNQNRREVAEVSELQGDGTRSNPDRLSSAESLCLGRCHAAHHVARDTVMFVFGSSQPSSNGVLGYDLRHDHFRRPHVWGCIPQARLCFASAFLPKQAAIWVQSGWSTQLDGVIDAFVDTNVALLHLAPALSLAHSFWLHASPRPAQPVTDEQVQRARSQRFFGHTGMQVLIISLFEEESPQEAAQDWLENRGPWSEQQALILQMIADGHVQMRFVTGDSDPDSDGDIESLEDAS